MSSPARAASGLAAATMWRSARAAAAAAAGAAAGAAAACAMGASMAPAQKTAEIAPKARINENRCKLASPYHLARGVSDRSFWSGSLAENGQRHTARTLITRRSPCDACIVRERTPARRTIAPRLHETLVAALGAARGGPCWCGPRGGPGVAQGRPRGGPGAAPVAAPALARGRDYLHAPVRCRLVRRRPPDRQYRDWLNRPAPRNGAFGTNPLPHFSRSAAPTGARCPRGTISRCPG
jgi:hypothetical protein